jgi:cobalt/nickel transport system permease protein
VGAGHGHRLHYHAHSRLHRAPAHLKILGLLSFMVLVVATPRAWYAAFAGYFVVELLLVAASRVPPAYLLKRMVVEVPFAVFALLMPFVATGPRIEIAGLMVSRPGVEAAAALLIKATLGVVGALLLAATTEADQVLVGLQRLRLPQQLVQIMGFMIRYLDVVTAELGRMLVAMRSRGRDPRSPRQWPALAKALGALFIRSYERGERVHLAMLSRGYTGRLPDLSAPARAPHTSTPEPR